MENFPVCLPGYSVKVCHPWKLGVSRKKTPDLPHGPSLCWEYPRQDFQQDMGAQSLLGTHKHTLEDLAGNHTPLPGPFTLQEVSLLCSHPGQQGSFSSLRPSQPTNEAVDHILDLDT